MQSPLLLNNYMVIVAMLFLCAVFMATLKGYLLKATCIYTPFTMQHSIS